MDCTEQIECLFKYVQIKLGYLSCENVLILKYILRRKWYFLENVPQDERKGTRIK